MDRRETRMPAAFIPFSRDALDRSIPDRFAEQVAHYPDRIAIGTGIESLTYRQLGQRVGGIAHAVLAQRGPASEPVALLLEQGAPLAAAALGVLAAGKHYVPLDPAHPRAHLLTMLRDLQPRLTLTNRSHRDLASRLAPDCGLILAVDEIDTAAAATAALPNVAPDALAYIFYTSGSTGRAKGVMDTHRNVLHNIMRYTNSLHITADDRFTLLQPASSSGAVSDLFGALLTGAALFPVDLHQEDLAGLAAWINRERLTIYHSAPAIFRHVALSAAALPSLRVIRLEGDTASPRDIDLFRSRCSAGSILVNGLGLTECGLVRQYFVTPATPVAAPVPVGYPVEDMIVTLIDADGQDVPVGEIGEIVVESRFLALGYSGRPDLTAARFCAVPDRPGVRRYRTGDLGRLRPDSCLEHLGRTDFQPKFRGHRIDTEGIEAALLELPAVSEAAVMVRADRPDDPRLVAYCVASANSSPSVSALRRHLTERLPRDLLPASYVWLDRLPLTDSGKVDRQSLPAPGRARPPLATVMTTPRTPVEAELARLWAETLGLDEVGADDDFFDLGGDSLQATHLVGRIHARYGIELGVPTLFASPTIRAIASIVAARPAAALDASEASTRIPARRDAGPFPLTFPQESLLFLSQLERGEPTYNEPLATRLGGPLAIDALGDALDALVARHEALRTTIQLVDGIHVQRVEPSHRVDLVQIDLSAVPDASQDAELERRLRAASRQPFDLGRDPMLRAHLFRLGANEHVLLLVIHHIATDGWSGSVLIRELSALYEAARRGQPPQLPALPIRYVDYATWQRTRLTDELRTAQLVHWRQRLAGAPDTIDLPHAGPQRLSGSARGATESIDLPADLVDAVRRTSREANATLFMTLLAAFKAVLRRYAGRDDIVVGTAIAGRTQPETEGLVGFFVNTLALRTDLSGNPTFHELVARVRATALEAFAHQDLPFAALVAELNPARRPGRMPLVQIAFVLEPPRPAFAPASLASEQLEIDIGAAAFELTLFVRSSTTGLRATAQYRTDLYDAPMIARLLAHWRNLLEAAAGEPKRRLSELPILAAAERHQLLVAWNQTFVDYRRDSCLHHNVEQQVEKTPDAVAVVCGGAQLTYAELNARANQLAHYLRGNGVGPDIVVGLCLERSLEMVVGLLGILKAGGAYLPLDPDYPQARLLFMLADAKASIVLSQRALRDTLPPTAAELVCLDTPPLELQQQPTRNPARLTRPSHLACVIYTSGSTGTPKGVMIEHGALVNHMAWMCRTFAFDHRDAVLQKTPISFDASAWEFFVPLLVGGRLVMAPPHAHRDPLQIIAAVREHGVTTLQLVPSLFRLLAQEPSLAACVTLARLFCGGEAFPLDASPRFFENSDARLFNLYGPTETCIDALWWECKGGDVRARAPIGRPIANTIAFVLDQHQQPVPVGVAGELYIGGDGLARGYLGRPDLTAQRFVPSPYVQHPGAILYRTGDRVRYLSDGNIEFLDRLDSQVKLRGFRIELGEIEAVLAQQPEVREAVMQLREDMAGNPRLVAYVVARKGTIAVASLRAFLKHRLPAYMMPATFVQLSALPLTPNGKIDRDALPMPAGERDDSKLDVIAPRDAIERDLVNIWRDLLKQTSIGVRDNFFDLGGHSLLAVQLMKRIDAVFNRQLPLDILWTSDGSIEAVANLMRDAPQPGAFPELVPIRTGSRRPLFMMFNVGGNLHQYFELARGLDAEQAVYGVQARGVYGSSPPDHRVEAMARHCIESMRSLQPEGPYLVAGFCTGGVIAFEVAQQLTAAGQRVALLALLDTHAPKANAVGWWLDEIAAMRRDGLNLRQLQELAYFSALDPLGLGRLRQLRTIGEAHRWGFWSYRPRPYTHAIELFVAEASAGQTTADKLGWTRWAHGVIRVHRLPGGHADLVKSPIVSDLSARLQESIDRAGIG